MGTNNYSVRVGVLTSTYARSSKDCQVPWMREQLRRFAAKGLDIHVMAPAFKGLKSHEIDGIPVHRFRYAPAGSETLTHDEGAPSKSNSLFYKALAVPYILCGMLAVFFWCVKHRIQVLHVHWPFPHGLWALAPKWLLGVKVITMSHGAELAIARRSKPVSMILGWILRRAHISCANSSHTAAEVKLVSGGVDSVLTPYGATVKSKEISAPAEGEIPLLLFCGRLIQRKGIHVLLRALPQVLEQQEVRMVITGEGDRKAEWEALSKELGLEDKVRFAGFVSDEELAELYATATAYVHPAIFDDNGDTEGLGVVLIEALAHEKPVVASGVGGIIDVIQDGETGLLVPEKNEDALAAAILKVLNDKELARMLGKNGLQHVRQFFDWERITNEGIDLYHSLLPKQAEAATEVEELPISG